MIFGKGLPLCLDSSFLGWAKIGPANQSNNNGLAKWSSNWKSQMAMGKS